MIKIGEMKLNLLLLTKNDLIIVTCVGWKNAVRNEDLGVPGKPE